MPKLKTSSSASAQFKRYNAEGRWLKNRIADLESTCHRQPNNEVAAKALTMALNNKLVRHSGRKSGGHTCKGMYSKLGFYENAPSDVMLKSKLPIHWYFGGDFKPFTIPSPKLTVREQFEALGLKMSKTYAKRIHKKATR